jgi:hypothetical protein
MRKKILYGIAVLTFAIIATINVNFGAKSSLSVVSLSNVEALAWEGNGTSFVISTDTINEWRDESGCCCGSITTVVTCPSGGGNDCYSGTYTYKLPKIC